MIRRTVDGSASGKHALNEATDKSLAPSRFMPVSIAERRTRGVGTSNRRK